MNTTSNLKGEAVLPFDYVKQRLEDQIEWYSRSATVAKRWYTSLSIITFSCAAFIPFLAGNVSDECLRFTSGLLGVVISLISGLISLFKWQENWIQFRATSEALKHEKYLFLQCCQPYDDVNKNGILTERVEAMISRENSSWSQYTKNSKPEKPHGN